MSDVTTLLYFNSTLSMGVDGFGRMLEGRIVLLTNSGVNARLDLRVEFLTKAMSTGEGTLYVCRRAAAAAAWLLFPTTIVSLDLGTFGHSPNGTS